MSSAPLEERLKVEFERLPRQLQSAARWVLDHPADVALLTLREQAKRAGILPATLTRLAKRLGFAGYDEIRRLYADNVRQRPEGFRGRAEELIALRRSGGEATLVQQTLLSLSRHLQALSQPSALDRFISAAHLIDKADTIYCWGLRSSFPVAYLFHYIRTLFDGNSVLMDGAGGIGIDLLRKIGPRDVLLLVTADPYTTITLEAAAYARKRGACVIAITDSEMSPIVASANEVLIVGTETPSFLHTMTPAFAAVECLAALVATQRGADALAGLAASEEHLANFRTYYRSTPRKRRLSPAN